LERQLDGDRHRPRHRHQHGEPVDDVLDDNDGSRSPTKNRYFVSFSISNDNPTFGSAPTFAGHNMVEVLRMAKTGTGTVVLFGYKNTTGSRSHRVRR
jgi:hypothetical protein